MNAGRDVIQRGLGITPKNKDQLLDNWCKWNLGSSLWLEEVQSEIRDGMKVFFVRPAHLPKYFQEQLWPENPVTREHL
jgi:hypothetical protein